MHNSREGRWSGRRKVNFLQPEALRSSKALCAHSFIQSAVEGPLWTDSMNPEPRLSLFQSATRDCALVVLALCFAYPNLRVVSWFCVPSILPVTSLSDIARAFLYPLCRLFSYMQTVNPDRHLLLTLLKCKTIVTKRVGPQIGYEQFLRSIMHCAQSRENQLTY